MKIDEKVKNNTSHSLGDYKGVEKTINCRHCNYLQYATNYRCLNCNEEISSEFIEMNYSDENKLFLSPFSFTGRIRRKEYILSIILFVLVLLLILGFGPGGNGTILSTTFIGLKLMILLVVCWFRIAQAAKRCHDRGNSGWFQIIPYYGLWMLFGDGEKFENKYGKNPKGVSLVFKD